jgi:hypothetical protein
MANLTTSDLKSINALNPAIEIQSDAVFPMEQTETGQLKTLKYTRAQLIALLQSQITAGTIVSFGTDRNAIVSPANNQIFFDTDDGICYQYATVSGWTAKMDFVSSAELTTATSSLVTSSQLTSAIASLLTQATADARYVQSSVLSESIDDRVAALMVAGANITLTYNDTSNTYTIAASIPSETIDDRVAALLLAGSNISLAYDNTANTLTINSTATSSGGGASGLKFTYNSTVAATAAGEIRAADLAAGGAIAINPTDAHGNAWTDLAPRLIVGAIILIAKDADNWVRGTITVAYASGSLTIGSVTPEGAIASLSTVYLSIWSDAPSVSAATEGGVVVGSANQDIVSLSEVVAAIGWSPFTYTWYRGSTQNFLLSAGTVLALTAKDGSDPGLAIGTYYYRRVATDQLGNKKVTPEISVNVTSGALVRPATKNVLTYAPTAAETYNFFNNPPLQGLSYLNDGLKIGATNGLLKLAGSGTSGELLIIATFSEPKHLNEIRVTPGQFNGAFNQPQFLWIYSGTTTTTLLAGGAGGLAVAPTPTTPVSEYIYDLIGNPNFDVARNQYLFRFKVSSGDNPIALLELELLG